VYLFIILIELMYIVFVPFDWTRALSPVCFLSVHNSMNFFCITDALTNFTQIPLDVYSVCDCVGTVYTCMNSRKEAFNAIMYIVFMARI